MFLYPLYYASRILILAAVLPAIFLLIKVYQADKMEKEPLGLILKLVLLGVASTFLAMITESIGSSILGSLYLQSSFAYQFLMYFVVVALSEEGFKYLMLKKGTWNNPEFNCLFDGIVYAISVALGFALFENINYVFSYGLGTAAVRAVTAVPGHACFGVFMGAWYGLAHKQENRGNQPLSQLFRICALLIPVLLHGTYDFIASGNASDSVFIIFIILLFIASYFIVHYVSSHDEYI